ncbi:MAG: periplasmic heavy metal sensor [Myxococcales bacterium]|nr:periplasmic heavy metal sensor [Myxococcales bacterium]
MTTSTNTRSTLRSLARRKLTAALVTVGLIGGLGIGVANAKPGKGAGAGAGAGKVEHMCQRLECTDNQKAQLQNILKGKRDAHKANREKVQQLQAQLAAEYRKARPNESVMQGIYQQLDTLEDQRRAEMHKTAMQIHAVLTPAQRDKVATAIEHRGPRALMGGKGHGPRGGKGKGKGKGKGNRGQKGANKGAPGRVAAG